MKTAVLLTLLAALTQVAHTSDKIIGGSVSNGYDFFLQLTMDGTLDRAFCGSTSIAPGVAVTAAHCVADKTMPIKLVHGLDQSGVKKLTVIEVNAVIPHQDYSGTFNDIALIFYNQEQAKDVVVPATINRGQIDFSVDNQLRAIGRGNLTSIGTLYDNLLYEVDVPFIENSVCEAVEDYKGGVNNTHLCAGMLEIGGKDSCQGDSGGPLVVIKDSAATLVGVTNFGLGCGQKGYPGVYASLKAHTSWVESNINRYKQNEIVAEPNMDFAFASKCYLVDVNEDVLTDRNSDAIGQLSLSSLYLPKTRFAKTDTQTLSSSAKKLCEFKLGTDQYVASYDKSPSQKIVIQNKTKNTWWSAQASRKTNSLYQRCIQSAPTAVSFDIAVGDGAAMIMINSTVGRLVELLPAQVPADAQKVAGCSIDRFDTTISTSQSAATIIVGLKNHINDKITTYALAQGNAGGDDNKVEGKLEATLKTADTTTAELNLINNSDDDLFSWEIRCNKEFSIFNANLSTNKSIRFMAPLDAKATLLTGDSLDLTIAFAKSNPNEDGKLECSVNRDVKVKIE